MEVEAMVRPVVEAAGLELVEATWAREQGRRILRVTVDREGGVDLDTIGEVSERVSRRLDLEGFDPGPYSLEVSSPGVERPLRAPHDFARRVGQRVKVKLSRPVDGTRTIEGAIAEASLEQVRITTESGDRAVSYQDIASARTVHDWTEDLKGGKRR
jgi:ribosome maturation factor RimP